MNPIGNLKDIFIGKYIEERINESGISQERVAKFIKYNEQDIPKIFESKSIIRLVSLSNMAYEKQ